MVMGMAMAKANLVPADVSELKIGAAEGEDWFDVLVRTLVEVTGLEKLETVVSFCTVPKLELSAETVDKVNA